jgi:hypothetical protein
MLKGSRLIFAILLISGLVLSIYFLVHQQASGELCVSAARGYPGGCTVTSHRPSRWILLSGLAFVVGVSGILLQSRYIKHK